MNKATTVVKPVRLGRADAAKYIGLSLRSIDALLSAQRLKSRRTGGRVFILTSELDRFANSDSLEPITSAVQGGR